MDWRLSYFWGMRNLVFILGLILCSCNTGFQTADRERILERLEAQVVSWNEGDLDGFMTAYLKTDSLMFVGRGGLNYGHAKTLKNYKRSYPNREEMGRLSFDIFELKALGQNNALVIGAWQLDRVKDTLSGSFSLNWQRVDGDWVIIADHSS